MFNISVHVDVYPPWFLLSWLASISTILITTSWSLIPPAVVTDVMRSGLVVQTMSNMLAYLVGF